MIVLVDRNDPAVRIELQGHFADDDAEVLLRTFPALKRTREALMPCDMSKYPPNWGDIRAAILERARGCCEGSPAYPDCRAANGKPHPVTGSKVVLTIAHLDHDTTHNDPSNLRALCQRCHLTHDAKHHAQTARKTRIAKSGQMPLL